ncbi:hypothetical protein EV702DRAFT_1202679 [Suillus placidus]|uniref:Uncharacterized protein n=1 Tax=Suillus placidus TaxID=48579 RepID=A0A9P6ZK81_9AGAM|nr:hypothetical protein EV702DRAFT_1202679 [Suillus placidus]
MHDAKLYVLGESVDSDKRNGNLLTKSVNAMMGRQETSHQQVMSYLVGGGDFYTSHTFQTIKWYDFMHAADRFDAECASSEVCEESSNDEVDELLEEEQVTLNVLPDTVEFSSDISDYSLRPVDKKFTDLCLWEFVESTVKIRGTVPADRGSEEVVDEDSIDCPDSGRKHGRRALPRAKFLPQHSQVDTHILRLRKKEVVPVLLGDAMPRLDRSEEEYEKYSRANQRKSFKLFSLMLYMMLGATGDLVLLEMKMTRYSKKHEDNKWHSHAQYEMIAISLLDIADLPEEDTQGATQIDGLAI